jgi:hypothetical protein
VSLALLVIPYFFVAILLQINFNDYSCVERVWLLLNFAQIFSKFSNFGDQPFGNTSRSDITRLPLPMPMVCQEFFFLEKRRERGKNK